MSPVEVIPFFLSKKYVGITRKDHGYVCSITNTLSSPNVYNVTELRESTHNLNESLGVEQKGREGYVDDHKSWKSSKSGVRTIASQSPQTAPRRTEVIPVLVRSCPDNLFAFLLLGKEKAIKERTQRAEIERNRERKARR